MGRMEHQPLPYTVGPQKFEHSGRFTPKPMVFTKLLLYNFWYKRISIIYVIIELYIRYVYIFTDL